MRSHARTPSGSPQNSLTRFCMPSTSKATCKVHIRVCNRLGDAAGVRRQTPAAMLLRVCALGCVASGQGWGMRPLLAGGGGRGAGARVRDDAGGDAPGVPAAAGARRCLGLPSRPGCSSPPPPSPPACARVRTLTLPSDLRQHALIYLQPSRRAVAGLVNLQSSMKST